MLWGKKKKDKGLPDLPARPKAIPSMADYSNVAKQSNDKEEVEQDIHKLPSFPDSPMKKGFSQIAIKDAVAESKNSKHLPAIPGTHEKPITHEIDSYQASSIPPLKNQNNSIEYDNSIRKEPKMIELHEWSPKRSLPLEQQRVVEDKPIYVKLDKFKAAYISIQEIQQKLNSLDELLGTIKDVKLKEEQELTAWEHDIELLKSKLNSIISDIFEPSLN